MKSILLGHKDINGRGETVLLAGTEVPIAEQIRTVTGIKATGKYPKGIVRVAFCEVIERNTAICITAASKAKAANQAGEAARLAELNKKDVVKQKQTALQKAQEKVSAAAIARNALISEQKNNPTEAGEKKLAEAVAAFETAETELKKLKATTEK